MPRPGSTTQRDYGPKHQRARAALVPLVATGTVACWRCGELIGRGEPWHLGHDDYDRTRYKGPEHPLCNLRAAAIKGNLQRSSRDWSEDW